MAVNRIKPWKKKANTEFGRFIRLRDCLKTMQSTNFGICFTCDTIIPYKGSHPGHFIQGRHPSVLYHEDNCHLQCYRCNIPLKGNLLPYYQKMEKLHGRAFIEALQAKDRESSNMKWYDYEEVYLKYKAKANEIQGS